MAYKQSPFPMIEGTSPVKSLSLAKFAIKYGIKGAKYIKKAFSKSKTVKPKSQQHFVKYDPKSQHLRFKTGGGKTTRKFVATKGTPGTKSFGFDWTRNMNVTPQQLKNLDEIIKIYKP